MARAIAKRGLGDAQVTTPTPKRKTKCTKGLHDWVEGNIITTKSGKKYCELCRRAYYHKRKARERKREQIEPEAEVVAARPDRGQSRPQVPRDYWSNLAERLKLLNGDEELLVRFPPGSNYQPRDSGIQWAAKKAGVRVGYEWFLDGRLYIWSLGRCEPKRPRRGR